MPRLPKPPEEPHNVSVTSSSSSLSGISCAELEEAKRDTREFMVGREERRRADAARFVPLDYITVWFAEILTSPFSLDLLA